MKTLDLKKTSKHKAASIINQNYGGKSTFKQAIQKGGIGIGQLLYIEGFEEVDKLKNKEKTYRANIEIYNDGIGVYVYNIDDNFLVLISKDEIDSFIISKPLDLIKPANFSFFTKMKNLGVDYYKCRFMLLEEEMIETHPVSLYICLKDGSYVKTNIRRVSPYKHSKFFKQNSLGIPFTEQLLGHLLLEE